ncbi:MAG TPA: PP2C family protein-serine/threonine phosphatase [Alloacidobacterium sp.]|nr:PP2C family protein-serine/threonine phosphatase [Alloacidobacterium sp.]
MATAAKAWDMGEHRVAGLLNFVVVAAVGAVAYTDWLVTADVSLAYLYVLPIALCALVNPHPFTIALGAICTLLGDIFGPPAPSLLWRVVHNVVYLASFLVVGFLVTLIARQRDRMAEEIRRQRDEYERDLALAAQVQHRVLPKPLALPGIDIAAEMKTARLLGGDYYDFFPVSDDVVDIVIADVSGKGAAAALLMPSLAVALRLRARELEGPAEVIADLDAVLKQMTNSATFVTMFYARLNRVSRMLQYANAGHNPPVLLRSRSCEALLLDEAGGPILGILAGAQFSDASVALAPGDILTLFTDGVTEQENEQGEEFSVDRLKDVVCREGAESAAQVVAHVSEAVSAFAGETEQADDLTLVVLKVL